MKNNIIILAAGKSSRFNDPCSKLLQPLGDLPVVCHVVQAAYCSGLSCRVVIGHQKDLVKQAIEQEFAGYCQFFVQEDQTGTGDAFFTGLSEESFSGNILVVNGDTPFLTAELLLEFTAFCEAKMLDAAVVTAIAPNPFGYGRLIFSAQHNFEIIEEKSLQNEQKAQKIINGGVYFFSEHFLKTEKQNIFKNIRDLSKNSNQEFNITDCVNWANRQNYVLGHFLTSFDRVRGINSLDQYDEAKNYFGK